MLQVVACITEQHDVPLVGLALLVCLLAGITGCSLLARAAGATGRLRVAWQGAAAIALGGGIWSTHFISILAYLPATGLDYRIPVTVLSLLVAIGGSMVALMLAMSEVGAVSVTAAGILFGLTVAAMHFVGMIALLPEARITFDPAVVMAALGTGVGFAVGAMWLIRSGRMLLAVPLLVLSVCGLHFVAMSATVLQPMGGQIGLGAALSVGPMAVAVAAVTLLLLLLSLFAAILDGYLAHLSRAEGRRLRRFADATFEGILFLRGNVVVDVNAALCNLLGRERGGVLGRKLDDLLVLPGGAAGVARGGTVEAELQDADGRHRPVELLSRAIGDSQDKDAHRADTVIAVRDLTDRRLAEQRIQHLAHHDSLTGLANRTLFRQRLAQAMAVADRSGHGLALLCLDLDGFKAVNDLMGHPVGDQVLVEVGRRLSTCLRDSDTLARLGGDEFAIVQCFHDQPRAAAELAGQVIDLLSGMFDIAGQSVGLGASVGIALYPSDADAPEVLMRNADLALYRAKHDGRGVFRFFEPDMDRRQQHRRTMEQELRLALLRDELRLHYQPLLDSATLEVDGYEALVRWEHPVRGRISPAEFIPVAEECGLIVPLGQWVLDTACTEAASWDQPRRIAVNLSPAQFRQRDLAEGVRRTLIRTGLAPSRLELEITEGILIDDAERALTMLHELKALGVRIALDDFGTGYSSLSYLRRFPFDKLKIDASFIRGLGDGGEADAIVRAIVGLGRSLGLHVTAEGVETQDQLSRLRAHECDQVQGFLLGRPVPASELASQASQAHMTVAA